MENSQKKVDISSYKLRFFDLISGFANVRSDGITYPVKDHEVSVNSKISRVDKLSKDQKRKLKKFSKKIYFSILKTYYAAIVETGDANILSGSPNESFYLDKIADQLGFMPSNEIFMEYLASECPKNFASLDMRDGKNEVNIYFSDTKISNDDKYLTITITCNDM